MKVSIKWIEVLLIALIAIAALAIWTETDRQLSVSLKGSEPNEIEIQQKNGVQSTQVDLAAQQKRLDALQERLSDRQTEQITQANDLQSLLKTYPQLAALPISGTPAAPLSVMQAYVQARSELSETTLLVNQLEADFTAAISSTIEVSETLASTTIFPAQRQAGEAQLLAAQALRDSLQKALVEARLKLPASTAKIASLEAAYPQLAQLTPEQQTAIALPTDVVKAHVDAQLKQNALDAEINALKDQTNLQQTLVVSQTIALAQAQRDAAQDLAQQQETYVGTRRWEITWRSLAGLLILIIVIAVLLLILRNKDVAPRWKVVIGGAITFVLVLLGYQALQTLGAVIVLGIVILAVAIALPSASATTSTQ